MRGRPISTYWKSSSRFCAAARARPTVRGTTLADELDLTEAGIAEILVNPLCAGRVIRHKGRPDQQERQARFVAADVQLRLTHVREILKNPIYIGQLRRGEKAGAPPLISQALWDQVVVVRSRYARRNRGPVSQRTYPLSTLLVCASCGRRLTGHVSRYRHVDACAEFRSAKPTGTPWRNPGDGRVKGESYKADAYDNLVPLLLERVSLQAGTLSQVVGSLAIYPDTTFALARIQQERQAATALHPRDRDLVALERTMARLDTDESQAMASEQSVDGGEALKWLRNLPALWEAGYDSGRRLLTEALFEKVEVLGVKSVTIHPTPEADAHGWSDAFGSEPLLLDPEARTRLVGARGVEPPGPITRIIVPDHIAEALRDVA